jgi:ABC-type Co2+ transport system permease subunit
MGQVNVNTPSGGTAGEPTGSSGAGFILGIIIAIILIAVLVYIFVLAPGGGGGTNDGGGNDGGGAPVPSGWVMTDRA